MLKKQWKKLANYVLALPLLAVTGLAQAAPAADAKHASIGSMLWLPLILIAVFYFLIIRPQNKRQREQKELMDQIALGDEVMTNSGILGKITRLRDSYIAISISKDTEVIISRGAVSQVLPKGTMEGIN
jgi:preprotein translocase subunit YajC